MSAFYALCFEDRIEILTDGAVYRDDGTLMDIRRKIWVSDHVPMAVTGRGGARLVENIAAAFLALSVQGSFDKTIELIMAAMDARKGSEPLAEHIEVLVAGISESSGPRLFYVASTNGHGFATFEPWQVYDAGFELGGGPMPTPDEAAALGFTDVAGGLASFGADLFEAMRRKPAENPIKPNLPPVYGIGGHVDHTVITREGIEITRLRTWDDRIGEPIDPYREPHLETA